MEAANRKVVFVALKDGSSVDVAEKSGISGTTTIVIDDQVSIGKCEQDLIANLDWARFHFFARQFHFPLGRTVGRSIRKLRSFKISQFVVSKLNQDSRLKHERSGDIFAFQFMRARHLDFRTNIKGNQSIFDAIKIDCQNLCADFGQG